MKRGGREQSPGGRRKQPPGTNYTDLLAAIRRRDAEQSEPPSAAPAAARGRRRSASVWFQPGEVEYMTDESLVKAVDKQQEEACKARPNRGLPVVEEVDEADSGPDEGANPDQVILDELGEKEVSRACERP